jgi:hypothetical protein
LAFIEFLRLIAEDTIGPVEAVHAYHGVLQGKGITPKLSLEQDLELTEQSMRYSDTGSRSSVGISNNPLAKHRQVSPQPGTAWPTKSSGAPDFASMSADERLAYHTSRLNQ